MSSIKIGRTLTFMKDLINRLAVIKTLASKTLPFIGTPSQSNQVLFSFEKSHDPIPQHQYSPRRIMFRLEDLNVLSAATAETQQAPRVPLEEGRKNRSNFPAMFGASVFYSDKR